MAATAGKAHNLVLDGGTITRAHAADLSAIEGGTVQVGANDAVAHFRRRGNAAAYLRVFNSGGQEGKWHGRVIAGLHRQSVPIDGPARQTRRRSGLESTEPQIQGKQASRQGVGWRLTVSPGRDPRLTLMDQPAQKGASG